MTELEDLRPTHVWVKRTLYLKGQDSQTTNQIVEFDNDTDEAMSKAFIEVLLDLGHELDIYTDFSPVRMDSGRYILQSDSGFMVVEIDPAWTEEQVEEMERMDGAEESVKLDFRVWGDIFADESAT